jgi:transcriptional regulator with XRE-family HTH domain
MDIKTLIGKRIFERRLFLNWTQDKLSEMSGIDKPIISKTENGLSLPTLDTLLKFGLALNVPIDYFIQDIDGYEPLSESETEMVYQYRRMDKQNKEMVREYIEFLSGRTKINRNSE